MDRPYVSESPGRTPPKRALLVSAAGDVLAAHAAARDLLGTSQGIGDHVFPTLILTAVLVQAADRGGGEARTEDVLRLLDGLRTAPSSGSSLEASSSQFVRYAAAEFSRCSVRRRERILRWLESAMDRGLDQSEAPLSKRISGAGQGKRSERT